MKKIICVFLLLAILLSVTGCGSYQVSAPMTYPDYTFDSEPTAMELRLTAVRAMQDLLSVPWCTEKVITYKKNGPVSGKQFLHEPGYTYAGILYSSASSGLFQFLEYYNYETGALEYEGDADALKLDLGASCADALLWGWSTVCNSVSGGLYPVLMVPANGYYPVGEYTIRETISSYNELPSNTIIENTPTDVMLASYAAALPADALISTPKNHAMMVIDEPVVTYKSDGTIDPENSYLLIQDQRGGQNSTSFYEVQEGNETLYFSGRTSAKVTFQKLYEDSYIPLTCAEFTGDKPYEKATVSVSNNATDIDALLKVTVEANYPLAVINLNVTDSKGEKSLVGRVLFSGSSTEGVPRRCQLNTVEELKDFAGSEYNVAGNTLSVEVVVSTGERFVPIEITL